jgi:quinol monooxygenase YgiN
MAIGAVLWGVIANQATIAWALTAASAGLLLGLGLIARFRLGAAEGMDLAPSRNWEDPVVAEDVAAEAGPVLVTVEYTLEPAQRAAFAAAMRRLLRPIRRRDGAVFWELFVDSAHPHRCLECFLVESWSEHLRQHDRATKSDREVEDAIRTFYSGAERTTHYVALMAADSPAR